MPHVIVKLWPGKSEQQKTRVAEAITKDIADILDYKKLSVSVAMEKIQPQDCVEKCTDLRLKTTWTSYTKSRDTDRMTSEFCQQCKMGQ